MSAVSLQDVEKIERFYLNSCTDLPLPLANSLHQSFPALNEMAYNKQFRVRPSKIPRSYSQYGGKSINVLESDAALRNNNRAKLAFLKMCESLDHAPRYAIQLAAVPSDSCQQNETDDMDIDTVYSSMSKAEFIKKLEEGYIRRIETYEEQTLQKPKDKIDRKYAKSDSVLAKSFNDIDITEDDKPTNVKSTTTIANVESDQQISSLGLNSTSTASKVIVTGFLLLIVLGIVKNAVESGTN